jgi:hypothetical protein
MILERSYVAVIPGRREAAGPESMNTGRAGVCSVRVHGFRARAFGAPRNDERGSGAVIVSACRSLLIQRHSSFRGPTPDGANALIRGREPGIHEHGTRPFCTVRCSWIPGPPLRGAPERRIRQSSHIRNRRACCRCRPWAARSNRRTCRAHTAPASGPR